MIHKIFPYIEGVTCTTSIQGRLSLKPGFCSICTPNHEISIINSYLGRSRTFPSYVFNIQVTVAFVLGTIFLAPLVIFQGRSSLSSKLLLPYQYFSKENMAEQKRAVLKSTSLSSFLFLSHPHDTEWPISTPKVLIQQASDDGKGSLL
jgi:hypothetical protein